MVHFWKQWRCSYCQSYAIISSLSITSWHTQTANAAEEREKYQPGRLWPLVYENGWWSDSMGSDQSQSKPNFKEWRTAQGAALVESCSLRFWWEIKSRKFSLSNRLMFLKRFMMPEVFYTFLLFIILAILSMGNNNSVLINILLIQGMQQHHYNHAQQGKKQQSDNQTGCKQSIHSSRLKL